MVRNTLANVLYFGLQFLVAILALPMLLRTFGLRHYGLLTVAISLTTLLQFLSLGLNVSLIRFTSSLRASANDEELQHFVGNAYALAGITSSLIGLGLTVLGLWGRGLIGIDAGEALLFRDLALILATTSFLNGMLMVPRGILEGLQRFDVRTP